MSGHGLNSTYNAGCRCDACREAHRVWFGVYRRSLGYREPLAHGLSGYNNWSCRCEVCFAAKQVANAARKSRPKT